MSEGNAVALSIGLAALALAACNPSSEAPAPAETVALFPIEQDGKWGYIDATGAVVIQPAFDHADLFDDGVAVVKMGKTLGILDKTGKVVEVKFDGKTCGIGIRPFAEGLASLGLRKDGKCLQGFIDKTGQVVIDFQFDITGQFSHGLAPVGFRDEESKTSGASRFGFIDRSGTIVIEPQYESASEFFDGLSRVVTGNNGPNGYIDTDGNLTIRNSAFDISRSQPFAEGLAAVSVQGRYGFIDKTGALVIQPNFEFATAFSGGLAHVRSGGKWGYIDRSGSWVIQPQFEDAWEFHGSVAAVRLNGSWRFIDKTGKTVAEVRGEIERLVPITGDVARAVNTKLRKWAYVGKTGRFIWDPQKLEPAAESGAAGVQPAATPVGSGPENAHGTEAAAAPPAKADARAVSDAVLGELSSGNIAQLYAGSAEAFRATASQADLEAYARSIEQEFGRCRVGQDAETSSEQGVEMLWATLLCSKQRTTGRFRYEHEAGTLKLLSIEIPIAAAAP